MMKPLAVALALACLVSPPASARVKESLLKFDKQRVINVCQRACMRGGSARTCCICNGGDWNGRVCF